VHLHGALVSGGAAVGTRLHPLSEAVDLVGRLLVFIHIKLLEGGFERCRFLLSTPSEDTEVGPASWGVVDLDGSTALLADVVLCSLGLLFEVGLKSGSSPSLASVVAVDGALG